MLRCFQKKRRSVVLLDISHTVPISGKLIFCCGVAEGTSPGGNMREIRANNHQRQKRQENILKCCHFFIHILYPLLFKNCP